MLGTCRASTLLEAYCEQVNICTEIALSCMDIDRHKRPNIADIIHQLNGTEAVIDRVIKINTAILATFVHKISSGGSKSVRYKGATLYMQKSIVTTNITNLTCGFRIFQNCNSLK